MPLLQRNAALLQEVIAVVLCANWLLSSPRIGPRWQDCPVLVSEVLEDGIEVTVAQLEWGNSEQSVALLQSSGRQVIDVSILIEHMGVSLV
eukprot:6052264-Amphidinium_carterae.2